MLLGQHVAWLRTIVLKTVLNGFIYSVRLFSLSLTSHAGAEDCIGRLLRGLIVAALIQFIGGLNAHMPSHIAVSVDTMRGVWRLNLPSWQQSRAISRLLAQLVRSRPDDWKAVLHIIDAELTRYAGAGDHLAQRARDYLAGWIKGHFYDLAEIQSKERIIASVKPQRRTKRTKASRPKKVGRS
ncbi:hypothetical protein [Acetobacter sp. AAB5]|uniref:hypothetical protein n=1 Tax=Acetobacter sp. AAB5 TaxID=3418370 RepID=UPI003CF334D5